MKPTILITTTIISIFMVTSSCVRVKPWEREILSQRSMSFDSEQHENVLDHTFYNAREGAAGGFESGGGGCGCN